MRRRNLRAHPGARRHAPYHHSEAPPKGPELPDPVDVLAILRALPPGTSAEEAANIVSAVTEGRRAPAEDDTDQPDAAPMTAAEAYTEDAKQFYDHLVASLDRNTYTTPLTDEAQR